MSMSPNIANLVNNSNDLSINSVPDQRVSSALLQAAAQMSAQESESPESPTEGVDHDDGGDETSAVAAAKRQPKRSRACQACRAMKIRCLPVEGQEACKACSKVNRQCIMPGPARKRQKTVHKVAELEKKINALTASLAAKTQGSATMTVPTPPHDSPAATTSTPGSRAVPPTTRVEKEYSWDSVLDKNLQVIEPGPKPAPDNLVEHSDDDDYVDVISRRVIDVSTATEIYLHWKTNMCVYQPLVAFSDDVDIEWLRQKRPMALLTILVVASGSIAPDIQQDLAVEVARQLADRVMFYNEKSIDLVQAMIVYTVWYGKHKFAKDLGFNHYIHSAVAMCLDLGLGKRSRQQTFSDEEDAELRRVWMGCYHMAGTVATVLRLPPLVKFSPYLEECLESLANHPAALPTDNLLCCLVRLTQMVQDVGLLFHMDDPGSSIPLNDSRTQYHLKLFERQLSEWVEQTRPYLPKPFMDQYEGTISLYIHEIALHNEHNVDDFRPMYRATGRETASNIKDFLTNAHFEAITVCVDSMEHAMNAFLSLETAMLRCAPALQIVWTAYVAVAMIRLHGVLIVPDSKYGSIFLPKLNVSSYLDKCIAKLQDVNTGSTNVAVEGFIMAFKKLKLWHVHRTMAQMQAIAKANAGAKNLPSSSSTQPLPTPDISLQNNDKRDEASSRYISFEPGPGSSSNSTTASPATQQYPLQPQLQLHQQHSPQNLYGMTMPPQMQQLPLHQQQIYAQIVQPFQMPTPNATSALLDPNTAIDASTFDIQNWDYSVGDLDDFEHYLNDAGWMGYLM